MDKLSQLIKHINMLIHHMFIILKMIGKWLNKGLFKKIYKCLKKIRKYSCYGINGIKVIHKKEKKYKKISDMLDSHSIHLSIECNCIENYQVDINNLLKIHHMEKEQVELKLILWSTIKNKDIMYGWLNMIILNIWEQEKVIQDDYN